MQPEYLYVIILPMKSRRKHIICWILLFQLMIINILEGAQNVYADLESADVFQDSQWELLLEYELDDDIGSLQSICVTDQYIVCLVNSSDKETIPDKLIAFYKNDTDENGEPVEQYSYAKTVCETDYEHGNGMTYSPETDEIVIAGGYPRKKENFGCLFVVDAKTLKFKRKIQITPEWRVRGVSYCAEQGCYLVQSCVGGGYRFIELDMNFQVTRDWYGDVSIPKKDIFQDINVCGNDIITIFCERGQSYNGSLLIYSREKGNLIGEYQLDLATDSSFFEAESMAELSPGHFLLGCAAFEPRRIALYHGELPMVYDVTTTVENGTITESVQKTPYGSNTTIEYQPDENFEVSEIQVDGRPVDVAKYKDGYSFEGITANHQIDVKCTEIPQFEITTSVVNGSVSDTQMIRRDQDFVIEYMPQEHYEFDQLLIDGEAVTQDPDATSYTLKDIQEAHSIEVKFKQIPFFPVTASAEHGKVSAGKTNVYRDQNYTLSFQPEKDYVLQKIYVDGAQMEVAEGQKELTLLNVQQGHDIRIVYRWKYQIVLLCILAGMTITLLGYLSLTIKRYRRNCRRRQERQAWKVSISKED